MYCGLRRLWTLILYVVVPQYRSSLRSHKRNSLKKKPRLIDKSEEYRHFLGQFRYLTKLNALLSELMSNKIQPQRQSRLLLYYIFQEGNFRISHVHICRVNKVLYSQNSNGRRIHTNACPMHSLRFNSARTIQHFPLWIFISGKSQVVRRFFYSAANCKCFQTPSTKTLELFLHHKKPNALNA